MQEIHPNPPTVNASLLFGEAFPHLVFRRFPSFSDSLSSSLIPDSALELSFSKSESSESSLPTDGMTNMRHKKIRFRLIVNISIKKKKKKKTQYPGQKRARTNLFVLTSSFLPFSFPYWPLSPPLIHLHSVRVCGEAVCGVCHPSLHRHLNLRILNPHLPEERQGV